MKVKTSITIFGIIGAILACVALYFVMIKLQNQPVASDPNGTQQPTQYLNTQQIPSDWQTYINEEYGFEFMHPSNLGYLDRGGYQLYVSDEFAKQSGGLLLGNENEIVLLIDAGFGNKKIVMQDFTENPDRYEMYEININDTIFKEYSVKNGIYSGYNRAYVFEDDDRFVAIRFVNTPLATQIISTFRFTE